MYTLALVRRLHSSCRLVVTHSSYVQGLLPVLRTIQEKCSDSIATIIPGRISRCASNKKSAMLKLTTDTPAGIKCLFRNGSSVQEVFLTARNTNAADHRALAVTIAEALDGMCDVSDMQQRKKDNAKSYIEHQTGIKWR